ncbi:unnamed protein product [Paramecium sonneborni]|uniref:WD40-repeat-containing domain n=1 Tax=Paramecium sonneborni TaxID=65129 RepID=A0A8S1R567_9CILI|nr:unnamed protein product [Paramecium sonneborni]
MSIICQEHQQQVVFYRKTIGEQKKQKLCEKCVVNMNKNLILIEDLEKQFNQLKSQFSKEIESKRSQNLQVLQQVRNQLQEQMDQITNILGKIIFFIDTQVKIIINLKDESIETLSLNNDFSTFQQLTCEESIIFNNIQTQLLGYIKQLGYAQFQEQLEKLINKIDYDNSKFYDSICQYFNFKRNLNNEPEMDSKWICEKHKDKIYYVDLNYQETVPNRVACGKCVPQYFVKYESLDTLKQHWENQEVLIHNCIEKNDKFIIQQISRTKEFMKSYKEQVIQLIDGCFDKIDQISKNQNWIQKNTKYLIKKDWYQLEKGELIQIANIFGQQQPEKVLQKEIDDQRYQSMSQTKTFIKKAYEIILELTNEQRSKFKDLFHRDFQEKCDQIMKTAKVNNNIQMKNNLKFQVQEKFSINERLESSFDEVNIFTITFNYYGNIMIAGYENKLIKVFNFDKGNLQQIQQLNHHTNKVTCLQFINESSSFISGSSDKTIVIWEQDDQFQWKCQQQLQGHSQCISCLIVSKSGKFIISGSLDTTIIIWKKVQNIWNWFQTLQYHKKKIISLSLNHSENQMISCAHEETMIQIATYNSDTQFWTKTHIIKTNQWGLSLHFINETLFTFQPYNSKIFQLYTKQNGKKEFFKIKDIQLNKSGQSIISFPQIFNNTKSLLLLKNGPQIVIFRITQDQQFIIDGLINFYSDEIIGSITPDFQYLVTWDNQSKNLQIRKLVEQS